MHRLWKCTDKSLNVTYKLPHGDESFAVKPEDVLFRGELAAAGMSVDPGKMGAVRPPVRRFGFSGKRKQRRRQLIAWAFNLLILILACGWLLLNLLINPERYAGSLSVAGMTDDEWRRTIIITALSSLPTSFLLIDGLKCTIRRSPSGSPASPLPRGVHVVSEQGARRSPTRRHRR